MRARTVFLIAASIPWGVLQADDVVKNVETKTYDISIQDHCPEDEYGCKNITLVAINRISKNKIMATGKALFNPCKDEITPCHFLGYVFRNKNMVYFVSANGSFSIKENNKQIFTESGEWKF